MHQVDDLRGRRSSSQTAASAAEILLHADRADDPSFSPYLSFSREEWSQLRAATPLTLSESDLGELQGINEALSMQEVIEVYLPLSRLLNLHVAARQEIHKVTSTFLGTLAARVPYIIGVAGSVAVGKSTTSRILQALLARWPEHPRVALVTTDGFLFPNRVLEERGLMHRKGFPESYDIPRLLQFVADVKSGRSVTAPLYSHLIYDIVPDEVLEINRPDILILEGLNVLQHGSRHPVFVSDFFDFSIYVDAREADLEEWYIARLLRLWQTAFRDPASYFHSYAQLSRGEVIPFAQQVWREINLANLKENIEPTRERAQLILGKGTRHAVQHIRLRKL
ncbi:type I pantothenate kinase [soil metagenome]